MDANIEQLLEKARAWRDADPDPETCAALDAAIQDAELAAAQADQADQTGQPARAGQPDPPDQASQQADAIKNLRACFEPPLTFGTAGLRGLKGPGPAHMNHLLIQRVTAVIADVLRAEVPDAATRGVVIGYDARHGSKELAETAAKTIAGAGLGVHVFDDYAPTPLAAFAALELEAAAGIVLTASHNPPEYLGYKVYWSNAAQLVSPIDQRISQALNALPLNIEIAQAEPGRAGPAQSSLADAGPAQDGSAQAQPPETNAVADRDQSGADSPLFPFWKTHGDALREAYLQAIAQPAASPVLKIAYSAMHGVGGALVKAALANQGDIEVYEVAEQAAPDGDFPTVNFPNPEEPGALDRLTALAAEVNADIAIATDPDADRMALAVPDETGRWQVLMGDQIGALMADYLLRRLRKTSSVLPMDVQRKHPPNTTPNTLPVNPFVINTVVSSKLLGRIAAHYGADFEQTLTGFKWIWQRALQREAQGDTFVFAYEDAIGFSPTRRVRDKDGIAAAVVIAEMAREAKLAGTGADPATATDPAPTPANRPNGPASTGTAPRTLHQRLMTIYQTHGLSVNRQVSIKLEGAGARERMAQQLQNLRENPPAALAGLTVTRLHDYQAAQSFRPAAAEPSASAPEKPTERLDIEPIPLPATDLIQLTLEPAPHTPASQAPAGTYYVSIRPSGTEPKLKIYLEYLGDSADSVSAAESTLHAIADALTKRRM